MTLRDTALAIIHLEFTRIRKQNPHLSVAQIMIQIKMPDNERNFPVKVWMKAKQDYQRDAQKMYEQKGSKN